MSNRDTAAAALATTSNAPAERKAPTVVDLINGQRAQIERALPGTGALDADRLARLVVTELRKNTRLAQCDPASLLGAMMTCAQLGLEPGGPLGQAYFVPFKKEVTFILGYRGMIDLAMRSGRVRDVQAHCVYENDDFKYEYGSRANVRHRPALRNRGQLVATYALAHLTNGGEVFVVLSYDDIEARRKRSRSKDNGPWVTDYDAMARKSAVRALASFMPLSTEFATALNADESVRRDYAVTLDQSSVRDVQPPEELTGSEGAALPAASATRGADEQVVDVPAAESPAPDSDGGPSAPADDEVAEPEHPESWDDIAGDTADGPSDVPDAEVVEAAVEQPTLTDAEPVETVELEVEDDGTGTALPPIDDTNEERSAPAADADTEAAVEERVGYLRQWFADAGLTDARKVRGFLAAYSDGAYDLLDAVPRDAMAGIRAALVRYKRGDIKVQGRKGTYPVLVKTSDGLVATRAGEPVGDDAA